MTTYLKLDLKTVTAHAPASCGNVGVGFDILGFAIEQLGDEITLVRREDKNIIIENMNPHYTTPVDIQNNTASVALLHMREDLKLNVGFTLQINKGIPPGSGLGSSAASAVAAIVALNEFLEKPLPKAQLAHYALIGEQIASGQKHPDNVIPSLYGGMVLTRHMEPLDIIQLPLPDCYSVFLLPDLRIHTKEARSLLSTTISLTSHIHQSANLAAFISALYQRDLDLLGRSFQDEIIEPVRAQLIPEFQQVKAAALAAGALGMTLSGSGPTLFAFARTKAAAQSIQKTMNSVFSKKHINTKSWILPFNVQGAYIKQVN